MDAFVSICTNNRVMIEHVLKKHIREDYRSNPIRQLNRFLDYVGLKVGKVGKGGSAKKKSVVYRLDEERLDFMDGVASATAAPGA